MIKLSHPQVLTIAPNALLLRQLWECPERCCSTCVYAHSRPGDGATTRWFDNSGRPLIFESGLHFNPRGASRLVCVGCRPTRGELGHVAALGHGRTHASASLVAAFGRRCPLLSLRSPDRERRSDGDLCRCGGACCCCSQPLPRAGRRTDRARADGYWGCLGRLAWMCANRPSTAWWVQNDHDGRRRVVISAHRSSRSYASSYSRGSPRCRHGR